MQFHGNLDNKYSIGTNKLIKNGAILVTDENDIINEFSEFIFRKIKNIEKNKSHGNSEFQIFFDLLSKGIKTPDGIALKTNKPVKEIIEKLCLMEIEGLINYEIGLRI